MQPTTSQAREEVNVLSANNTHEQNWSLLTNKSPLTTVQLKSEEIKDMELETKIDSNRDTFLNYAIGINSNEANKIKFIEKIINGIYKNNKQSYLRGYSHDEKDDEYNITRIKNALNLQNQNGDTPLHKAISMVQNKEFDLVELLLKSNAEIEIVKTDISNNNKKTPIEMLKERIEIGEDGKSRFLKDLVTKGHHSILKILLEDGNYLENEKNALLKSALAFNYKDHEKKINMVELLLKNGAQCEIETIKENTTLDNAARFGATYLAKTLIEGGVNNLNKSLQLAVSNGQSKIVNLLIDKGANPKGSEENLLHLALQYSGRIGALMSSHNDRHNQSKAYTKARDKEISSIVKKILDHNDVKDDKSYINAKNSDEKTPLEVALIKKCNQAAIHIGDKTGISMVGRFYSQLRPNSGKKRKPEEDAATATKREMYEARCSSTSLRSTGGGVSHVAQTFENFYSLEVDSSTQRPTGNGGSPGNTLFATTEKRRKKVVTTQSAINPIVGTNAQGSASPNMDVTNLLSPAPENALVAITYNSIPLSLQMTALQKACMDGNLKRVNEVITSGNVNQFDPTNKITALHIAANNGNIQIVQALLRNGARADLDDIYGYTAQHVATLLEFKDVSRALIEAERKLNLDKIKPATAPEIITRHEGSGVDVATSLIGQDKGKESARQL